MSKKAILIQNLKYRMKNEYLLKDISFHLSEKNHLGIIYNHQDENKIKIFTNILNYKDNHYQGNIFFYEKLKLKKPIKINDFDLPTFDLLNFNHFKNKKILDVFISIFFRLEPNKLILEKLMKNWKQFSISNNTFILNKEIALMIDFLKNQNKNFKEFIDKWTQPVEQHFKKIKLKNYKEFTTFLDSYIENRENFLKIAAENMVNNQNEIMSLYLNVPDNFYEKFSQINQNYPKISELLVDNEIEDINSLKNNLEELKNKIEELKNKINEKRITVYYFWKYLLEDFKKEIKFAKMSFKNSKNFYDKLFWFKKLKILKIQFSKIKKNRSDLWKLSIPEIIVLLKNLEKYNKEISDKTTFITLNLNNKSKYKIYLELKSLWDFNFYHYKIESKNELNVLSKELQQLEKDYQNLNSKAVKINDYNQEQLVKKISEETFLYNLNIANKKWEEKFHKTEIITLVENVQNEKKDIFDNFKNLNNLLNDLDSKFISQINKLDLLFIFLGKKHQQRQKIKNYKKLFLKYQTNNVLSHLEQINYLFASDKSELKNQDLILGIYFLTDIFKRLKLEYKILWDNYEDLTIEEKIKLNLAISQFLDSKIYLLDLNIYQLSVETREIISNFLKNKTTIYFGNWEVVKNSDINYAMFFTRGLILEMAPKKTFFNKPINNYLSHFLKTKEWDYSKIENLNNDQYWQLIHEKKYVKISENHWSYINNTSGKKAKIEGKNGKKV